MGDGDPIADQQRYLIEGFLAGIEQETRPQRHISIGRRLSSPDTFGELPRRVCLTPKIGGGLLETVRVGIHRAQETEHQNRAEVVQGHPASVSEPLNALARGGDLLQQSFHCIETTVWNSAPFNPAVETSRIGARATHSWV